MSNFLLALKLTMNELKFGWKHFKVFLACLMLGVTVMACVNSVASLVQTALNEQANSILGGDAEVVLRGMEATDEQRQYLESFGKLSSITSLRTMLYFGEEATLVEIKAVDAAYPLIGDLAFEPSLNRDVLFAENGVAVDSVLLSQLGLKIGDIIGLGKAKYTVRAVIASEPDRAFEIFSFGPRVMMSQSALRNSGLVNTFGLIDHRYRILQDNDSAQTSNFDKAVQEGLNIKFPNQSWRVSGVNDGNQIVRRFTDQLLSFLALSGLATFLIAGIGIASSARSYLSKKLKTIAILKTLGGSRAQIALTYILVLGALALVSGMIGSAIAWLVVTSLIPFIIPVLPILSSVKSLPLAPMLLAVWYGFLITFLFSIPALYSALKTQPSLLFRSKSSVLVMTHDRYSIMLITVFAAALIFTLLLSAQDTLFILSALGIIAAAFLIFSLCTLAVKALAKKAKPKTPWLKLAVGNLYRPGSTTGTVVYAIGISLMVLIALLLTESNLQARITKLVDEQAPSLFLVDVQSDQVEPLQKILSNYASSEHIMIYPMIRGMITQINGKPVDVSAVPEDIQWAVRGDRGLSYAAQLPKNANLVQGEWWPENYAGKPLISVDNRFMEGLGLKIGSTLTVTILGEEITATVASARTIDYTSFQINFSLMMSPNVLEAYPKTFLSTVYLNQGEQQLARQIAKELPGITIVRTKQVLDTIREMIGYIAIALRITVAISLFAGILVLIAALSATVEQRLYDIAVFKVLGARKADILKACSVEWILLALITSLIAAGIGTFSAYLINQRFRATEFNIMPEITVITVLSCIMLIWITGYLTNNRLFNFRPSAMLRNE